MSPHALCFYFLMMKAPTLMGGKTLPFAAVPCNTWQSGGLAMPLIENRELIG